MKLNLKATATLDFEFALRPEVVDGKVLNTPYVWDVGLIITTASQHIEVGYPVRVKIGEGLSQREGLLKLIGYLERYKVNVIRSHHKATEAWVLMHWCRREGISLPKIAWLDTWQLAKDLLPRHYKDGKPRSFDMESLMRDFKISRDGEAHTALPDARGCLRLFGELMKVRHGMIPIPKEKQYDEHSEHGGQADGERPAGVGAESPQGWLY